MHPPETEYENIYDYDYNYDDLDGGDAYLQYYDPTVALNRTSLQYIILSLLVLVGTVVYHLVLFRNYRINSPTDLLWDAAAFFTPARVLESLDNWLNPPLFPRPMLQTQPRPHAAKVELLRRILRMDKSGGMKTGIGGGILSRSAQNLILKRDWTRPPGLGNWDNSCYQNSILQGLASLSPLPRYLAVCLQDADLDHVGPDTAETLRTLIAQLNDSSNNGTTLWTPAKLKNMSTWQQQDAQEYFSKLLDDIDREVAKAVKAMERPPGLETECGADETAASQHSDDSGYHSLSSTPRNVAEARLLRNPLEGLIAQRVACVRCGHSDGLSMIPFNCLTLSLDIDKQEYDLYERLDAYSRVESIEGVECGKCTLLKLKRLLPGVIERSRQAGLRDQDIQGVLSRLEAVDAALEEDDFDDRTIREKCNISVHNTVNSTKTKQAVIARPPQSLAIHINRSVFDESTGHMFKNLSAIRFPSTFDLGPWCLGSAEGPPRPLPALSGLVEERVASEGDATLGADEEQWLLDPRSSMCASGNRLSKISGPIYELRAVVTHVGRHETGHYICYRKLPRMSAPESPVEREPAGPMAKELKETAEEEADQVVEEIVGQLVEDSTEETSEKPEPSIPAEPEMDWWRLSDENVWQVDEETVLAQGGVFMLFYDCVEPHPTLVSALKDEEDVVSATTTSGDALEWRREKIELTPESDLEALKLATTTPLPEGEDDDLVSEDTVVPGGEAHSRTSVAL